LNESLSTARADAVKKALIARGVSGDRSIAKGYGSDKPIDDDATDAGQRSNRRVEFKIVKRVQK
jgi:OmpA-OmpF porin, OOP family